jgi:hypothetical protein
MQNQEVINVRRGIWIEERWLRRAGLGSQLQVVVESRELRILSLPEEAEQQKTTSDRGWMVFRSLGTNAEPGKLQNAAQKHDRYLYGKTQ